MLDAAIALAAVAAGWAAIAIGLRRSLRDPDITELATDHLAGKTARWRRPSENRVADKFALTHQGGLV